MQFAVCISAFSQNLVPNPSFEIFDTCPNGSSQSTYAQGWTININSTEYYHACSSSPWFSTPNASAGYQCPANGNGYCGIYCYHSSNPAGGQEYLGTQLLSPLIVGQKYYLSFKVSLANLFNCGVDKLGAVFTNVFYGATAIPYAASNLTGLKIYSSAIITDTANWVTIRATFYPDSTYNYVLFGNLADTNNFNNFICFDTSGHKYSYYYIDDVCISTDSITCEIPDGPNVCDSTVTILETNLTKEKTSFYPNPTINKILIDLPYFQKATVKIYNSFGLLLFDNSFSEKNIIIDLSSYPDGIYLIQVQQDNQFFNKKITVIK